MIVMRALYGLKSSGAPFRTHLANTLRTMGFKLIFSDHNVWMRKKFLPLPQELNDSAGSGTRTSTTELLPVPNTSNSAPMSGMPYYEYICTWVDALLAVSHNATFIMLEIRSVYKLKAIDGSKETWDPPKRYLGVDFRD